MKKINFLPVVLFFTSSISEATVFVTEDDTPTGQQYYLNSIETDATDVYLLFEAWSNASADFNVGAGLETSCPDSYRRYTQGDDSTTTIGIRVEVELDTLLNQSGWDSWAPMSTKSCNLQYKMAYNSEEDWYLEGTGVSWSNGGGSEAAQHKNSSFSFDMYKPECESGCTPIVVDILGNGFSLTSIENGVMFDIDVDGDLEQTAWTAEGSDDAFLFFDIDNDNMVTATELFGNHNTLLSGEYVRDGFVELAELDLIDYDGNDDGIIDKKDYYFDYLSLWQDANHNGESEPDEVIRLKDVGIESVSLDLEEIDWTDEYGNWIEFASWALGKDKNKNKSFVFYTADIWFVKQEIN